MCIRMLIMFLINTVLVSCNSNDPISSLHSGSVSTTYNEKYWMQQQEKNTITWQKAWKLCNSNPNYAIQPSCQMIGNVAMVAALSASTKKLAAHNHHRGFGADNFPNLSSTPTH